MDETLKIRALIPVLFFSFFSCRYTIFTIPYASDIVHIVIKRYNDDESREIE